MLFRRSLLGPQLDGDLPERRRRRPLIRGHLEHIRLGPVDGDLCPQLIDDLPELGWANMFSSEDYRRPGQYDFRRVRAIPGSARLNELEPGAYSAESMDLDEAVRGRGCLFISRPGYERATSDSLTEGRRG
jgi:hypothetical protein